MLDTWDNPSENPKPVERIVMTSCISAISGGKHKPTYTEENWADPDLVTGIEKSKLFAERAANYFTKEYKDDKNQEKLKLTVINPGFLLGPTL